MTRDIQPWLVLCVLVVFWLPFSQSNSPQNIETFYPTFQATPTIPISPPTGQDRVAPPKSTSTNNKNSVLKAVAITAATTLVVAGLFFFMIQKRSNAKRKKRIEAVANSGISGNSVIRSSSGSSVAPMPKFDGNLKGFIVDENGLDMVYWRKLEGIKYKNSYRKEVLNINPKSEETEIEEEDDDDDYGGVKTVRFEQIHETPLLRGRSSCSEIPDPILPRITSQASERESIAPAPPPPQPKAMMAIPKRENRAPPPPPPPAPRIVEKNNTAPPPPPPPRSSMGAPPPPPPPRSSMGAPPPPPPPRSTMAAPPPPPPPRANVAALPRPPVAPKKVNDEKNPSSEITIESENVGQQVKMKPLHWDKVNATASHSMVWHKLDGGSFNFDGDMMEALFGTVASNRKSPKKENPSSSSSNSIPQSQQKIFILDSRKSQNTAIVLRSLTLSRKEILDSLIEGQGLNTDTLEKLSRIAPTQEEESQIVSFNGDPTKLADAESFLYHLLKAVPLAFPRIESMFFRSNYVFEIIHFKESLQTLELACKELRTRGLFLKLLEAVLKSGNRMNAGTSRGNAQAFNLSALRKLSDVKSTDGKTTLLHFVVEEVVRSEGKRCVLNRKNSLSRSQSNSSNSRNTETTATRDEREKEYIKLGLPIVGGVSSEFTNVKKAASIDYDGFIKICSALTTRLAEIKRTVTQCASIRGGGGGFVREMNIFIESAEAELKQLMEEQTKVMELIKKTTEYYQTGSLKEKAQPFQLFVIVKDFLGMVDQVCVDITRNLQRRKTVTVPPVGSSSTSSPKPPAVRQTPVRFPILPEHFMSDKSKSSSSDSSGEDS